MEKMNESTVSEVKENKPIYKIVHTKIAKEVFDMEDNNCYESFKVAPKVAPKVLPQKTEAVYVTNGKYFTGLAVVVVLVAIIDSSCSCLLHSFSSRND